VRHSSFLYLLSYEEASEIASSLGLNPSLTFIEPSRYCGYMFDDLNAATAFRLAFDARRWPTTDDDHFLMIVEPTPEIASWLGSCGVECLPVETVAVQFRSEQDRADFEEVLWPSRP
jgi:hypothetical protein